MSQYTSVEKTLKRLELLQNYRELTAPIEDLKTLCMYLRFLNTFLVAASKFPTENKVLKDLPNRVQECVENALNLLPSLCVNEEEEKNIATDNKQNQKLYEWVQKVKILTPDIRTCYNELIVLQSDTKVIDVGCVVKLVNSLLMNLKDILESDADLIDSVKKQLEALEVKLRFLGNIVWFSSIGSIKHAKLEDLLRLIEAVARTGACLSFQCLFEDKKNEDTIVKVEVKLSQVLWTIEIIEPGLREAYVSGLKDSASSQLAKNSPTGNELAMGFLQSFLNDLEELLSHKSILKASVEDQLRNLQEELKFLIVFLMNPVKQNEKRKINDEILQSIEAVARQTAPVIHLLLVSIMDKDAAGEVDLYPLFNLLKKINHIKEALTKAEFSISKAVASNFPIVNASELIDYVLGTLNKVLTYKSDSIAFVRYQLGIVKAKLVCLKSLHCYYNELEKEDALKTKDDRETQTEDDLETEDDLQTEDDLETGDDLVKEDNLEKKDHDLEKKDNDLEEEVTNVVHEAKHAICSLIIREHPLWQCVLQLSIVTNKIQSVNNKLAAISVGETVENEVDTNTQNSDSTTLVALPPEVDKLEVGDDKETDATALKDKVLKGSTRLRLIAVSIVIRNGIHIVEGVYREIAHRFPARAWISVRDKYEKRELLIDILQKVTRDVHGEIAKLNVKELQTKLYNHLESARYLIVLNDEWGSLQWEDISSCFPNNNIGSRIILPGLPE